MAFAVIFSLAANESHSATASELMYGIIPFILVIDFFFRFLAQQTPSQQIKPYTLIPISRYACIDSFIANSLFSLGNLTWFAMLIPYAIMSVIFPEGIWVTLGFLIGFYLLVLINSQWYMLVRSLINHRIWWWILPIIVYAIIFSPIYIGSNAGFNTFCDIYADWGYSLSCWKPLMWIILLVILAILIYTNRHLQYRFVYDELSKTEHTKLHHVSQFNMFNRFHEMGEYLKLEVKSIMRNKNIRKGFIFATSIVLVLSLLISFTDIYDNMVVFWCIYNFAIYGAMILVKIMCHEGNYIECLMVRQENIMSLLRAKYYFYCAVLLLPLLITLIPVFTGKFTILMILAYLLTATGPVYFMLFQLAVWNKQTLPLNDKITGKNQMENKWQAIASMVAMFVPVILVLLLQAIFDETVAYITLIIIGAAFTLTESWWLRNIYSRMMKRRYVNLEGFHATR